jgi:hypothetical protein
MAQITVCSLLLAAWLSVAGAAPVQIHSGTSLAWYIAHALVDADSFAIMPGANQPYIKAMPDTVVRLNWTTTPGAIKPDTGFVVAKNASRHHIAKLFPKGTVVLSTGNATRAADEQSPELPMDGYEPIHADNVLQGVPDSHDAVILKLQLKPKRTGTDVPCGVQCLLFSIVSVRLQRHGYFPPLSTGNLQLPWVFASNELGPQTEIHNCQWEDTPRQPNDAFKVLINGANVATLPDNRVVDLKNIRANWDTTVDMNENHFCGVSSVGVPPAYLSSMRQPRFNKTCLIGERVPDHERIQYAGLTLVKLTDAVRVTTGKPIDVTILIAGECPGAGCCRDANTLFSCRMHTCPIMCLAHAFTQMSGTV